MNTYLSFTNTVNALSKNLQSDRVLLCQPVILAHLHILLLLAFKSSAVFHSEPAVTVDIGVQVALVIGELDVIPLGVVEATIRHPLEAGGRG